MLTPEQLLRLYPKTWRLQYGAEFLAVLETSNPSWHRTRDVARAAAWEWLRWTNTGRSLIALLVGAAGAICTAMATRAGLTWSLPEAVGTLEGWPQFFALGGLFLAPILVATMLVVLARPAGSPSAGVRFGTQLLVLFTCVMYSGLFLSDPVPSQLTAGTLAKRSVGNGLFVCYFLWLVFNIARQGGWRRRRCGDS